MKKRGNELQGKLAVVVRIFFFKGKTRIKYVIEYGCLCVLSLVFALLLLLLHSLALITMKKEDYRHPLSSSFFSLFPLYKLTSLCRIRPFFLFSLFFFEGMYVRQSPQGNGLRRRKLDTAAAPSIPQKRKEKRAN